MTGLRSLTIKAVAVFFFAGAIAVPVAFGTEPTWRQLAPAPAPRQEVSYTALGGRLYLAAGGDRSQDRYDPAANSWTEVAELPASFNSLDHVSAVAVGGEIVYTGGLSQWEYPFPVSGATSIYDPLGDSFATGVDMPSPRAAGGAAAWHDELIYAGGLGSEGSVTRVDAFDPLTGEWTRLEDMPRPRDHFQAAVVGDELYAIGGRRTFEAEGGIEFEDIAAIDVLDLPTDDEDLPAAKWRPAVSSIPTPRGGLGVAAVGTCVYAIGGELESGVTGATESYDTVGGEWRALPSLATPRHGIEAATVGKTIYVAGGGTEPFAYNPTAANEALDVAATAPCVATQPAPAPAGSNPESPARDIATRDRALRIERLSVRPRRVRLRSGPPRRRGAKIVLFLSEPGRVSLRLPQRFRLDIGLGAGRNVLFLPTRSHGRLLPRGRHRLVATPQPDGQAVRAPFRVVG